MGMGCLKSCFCKKTRRTPPSIPRVGNYLYALDFDQTILQEDSEAAISAALEAEIPPSILDLYDGENWAEFCGIIIDYVVRNGGSMAKMEKCIRELQPLPGMKTLLLKISDAVTRNSKSRFIVISGSNDFFIRTYLEGLHPTLLAHTHIISNHAQLTETEPKTLAFTPYEDQRSCNICPRFLCKGTALQEYIARNGPFTQVYYVGDGCNDVCPAEKLAAGDILFARSNYDLERLLRFGFYGGRPIKVRAKIIYFRNAKQIQKHMKF